MESALFRRPKILQRKFYYNRFFRICKRLADFFEKRSVFLSPEGLAGGRNIKI